MPPLEIEGGTGSAYGGSWDLIDREHAHSLSLLSTIIISGLFFETALNQHSSAREALFFRQALRSAAYAVPNPAWKDAQTRISR